MSGTYQSNEYRPFSNPSGTPHVEKPNGIDYDALWAHMYIRAKRVIQPCRWCDAANAITNEVCVHCGGPDPTREE